MLGRGEANGVGDRSTNGNISAKLKRKRSDSGMEVDTNPNIIRPHKK